jgi:hypothetical protein
MQSDHPVLNSKNSFKLLMSQLHHPPTKSNSFLLKPPKCPSLKHLPSGFITATPKISTKMLAVMLDLWKKNEQTDFYGRKQKKLYVTLKRP